MVYFEGHLISTFLLQLNSRHGKYYNDSSDYQSVVIETVQLGRRFNVFIAFFYVVELLYTLKPSEIGSRVSMYDVRLAK
jgi:hypothetical protein